MHYITIIIPIIKALLTGTMNTIDSINNSSNPTKYDIINTHITL